MPKINLIIPHSLKKEEALQRIKRLLSETKAAYSEEINELEEQWVGNRGDFSFKAKGFKVEGTLEVRDSHIELQGKIPLLISAFKGTIEKKIRDTAERVLKNAESKTKDEPEKPNAPHKNKETPVPLIGVTENPTTNDPTPVESKRATGPDLLEYCTNIHQQLMDSVKND